MATQTHTVELTSYTTPGALIARLSEFPADAEMRFAHGDYDCEAIVRFDPGMSPEEKVERTLYKQLKAKYG